MNPGFRPPAVIVDIDGTVARKSPGRGIYEYDKVCDDKPIKDVVEVVRCLYRAGHEIIFVTGREDSCRDVTTEWLQDNVVGSFQLFMRPQGDYCPGHVLKADIYDGNIDGHYDVIGVFEDDPDCALMYYDLGLTVFGVGRS